MRIPGIEGASDEIGRELLECAARSGAGPEIAADIWNQVERQERVELVTLNAMRRFVVEVNTTGTATPEIRGAAADLRRMVIWFDELVHIAERYGMGALATATKERRERIDEEVQRLERAIAAVRT